MGNAESLKSKINTKKEEIFFRLYTYLERKFVKPLHFSGVIEIDVGDYIVEIDFSNGQWCYDEERGRTVSKAKDRHPFKFYKTITYQSAPSPQDDINPYSTEKIREIYWEDITDGHDFSVIVDKILDMSIRDESKIRQIIKNKAQYDLHKIEIAKEELETLDKLLNQIPPNALRTIRYECRFCGLHFPTSEFDLATRSCLNEHCSPKYRNQPTLSYNTYVCGGDTVDGETEA